MVAELIGSAKRGEPHSPVEIAQVIACSLPLALKAYTLGYLRRKAEELENQRKGEV